MQGAGNGERWLEVPATPAEAELRGALDQAAKREPDEVALRRVWARLAETQNLVPMVVDQSSQLRDAAARRGRWPWIVAASLAGAAATFAFMFVQTKSDVRLARVSSSQSATVTSSSKHEMAEQRSTLVGPATVRTGFGETLRLNLRGGTEVTITSESALVLDEVDRPSVSIGEVQFHVPPQPAGRTFDVGAGAYRVVVVGTRFRVRVNHLNAAVGVDEGTVEVWSDHRLARVNAGESWVGSSAPESSTGLKSDETVSGPSASDHTPDHTMAPSAAGAPHTLRTVGPVRGSGGSSSTRKVSPRARARLEARQATKQVVALVSPVSGRSFAGSSGSYSSSMPAVSSTSASTTGPTIGAGPSSSLSGDANTVAPPPVVAPQPVAPPQAAEVAPLALQARAARASGEPRKALELYRTLAQKGGAAGENAEYEMGRVLRDDLHQPTEAVATWRAYRAQHPRGLLRIEADISVIETLVTAGDKSGALAEGSEFIRRYPDSERRMEMARLTGDLLREKGDCSGAIGAYDLAMTSGRGRRDIADGVSFHRSTCLLRGDRAAGLAALRTYLQSFPSGHFRLDAQRLLADVPSPTPATARP